VAAVRSLLALAVVTLACANHSGRAFAQAEPGEIPDRELPRNGVLELQFTPTEFAQIAVWVESEDGQQLATVRLTEAVALGSCGGLSDEIQLAEAEIVEIALRRDHSQVNAIEVVHPREVMLAVTPPVVDSREGYRLTS
jgi:hypothetical protein